MRGRDRKRICGKNLESDFSVSGLYPKMNIFKKSFLLLHEFSPVSLIQNEILNCAGLVRPNPVHLWYAGEPSQGKDMLVPLPQVRLQSPHGIPWICACYLGRKLRKPCNPDQGLPASHWGLGCGTTHPPPQPGTPTSPPVPSAHPPHCQNLFCASQASLAGARKSLCQHSWATTVSPRPLVPMWEVPLSTPMSSLHRG